jgi:hypothetical protein
MKFNNKLRVIVIILLIIFFGLLILFGSRNIYEGATGIPANSRAVTTATPSSTPPAQSCKIKPGCPTDFADPSYNSSFIPGTGKFTGIGTHFINVYYAYPDISKSGSSNPGPADLPIVYLYHNIPDTYKLYFTNMGSWANLPGTRIYIQKPSENKDVNKVKPTLLYKQYAIIPNNKDENNLTGWKKNMKWAGSTIDSALFKEMLDKPYVAGGKNVDGKAGNTDGSDPKATNILPITYDIQLDPANGKTIWFDAAYNQVGNGFVVPTNTTDKGRTADGLGFLNLVTYYLTLPK